LLYVQRHRAAAACTSAMESKKVWASVLNAGFCSGRSHKMRAQRASENARLQKPPLGRHHVDAASKQPIALRNGDGQPPCRAYARCSLVPERACPTRRWRRMASAIPLVVQLADKFLACIVLDHGFARIRCDACAHEYLLAFSCKCGYFCPSCHAKRLAIWAQRLDTTLLAPMPLRQLV